MTNSRRLLLALTMWLPVAGLLLTRALWITDLPSELPTHWGMSGPADAVTHTGSLFGWLVGISVVGALVGTVLLWAPLRGKWVQRATAAVFAVVAFYPFAMWMGSAAPSRGVSDPFTVELGPWFALTLLAPAYGLIPLVLYPKIYKPALEIVADAEVSPLELRPGEVASWSRTVSSKLFVVMTIVVAVMLAALYAPAIMRDGLAGLHWSAYVGLLSVLFVAVFCAFRVTVDWRGFRVSSGLFGFPLKRLAPSQIVDAQVAEINPAEWGGWGYRITPGRSAIVLRQGPGVVLTQANGKLFAVTLDRPEEIVGVLRGLVRPRDEAAEHAEAPTSATAARETDRGAERGTGKGADQS